MKTSISGAFVLALTIPAPAFANPTYVMPEVTITAPAHKQAKPSYTPKPVLKGKCYTRIDREDGTKVRICENVKPASK